ncbi:uncharacterized protein LOC116648205 [Phoca vitulina]|uniref:uncharacterized protein LOC116648205 n=1 Tax=Phoca vitulina TaxID=9720 RepID=UPI00139628DD|nr:uncharacterized protein LOC116648205 [Phoca vitulina]
MASCPGQKALPGQPPCPPTAACVHRFPQDSVSAVPIQPHTPTCPGSRVPQGTECASSCLCSRARVSPTSHLPHHHTQRHQLAREPCAFIATDASVIASQSLSAGLAPRYCVPWRREGSVLQAWPRSAVVTSPRSSAARSPTLATRGAVPGLFLPLPVLWQACCGSRIRDAHSVLTNPRRTQSHFSLKVLPFLCLHDPVPAEPVPRDPTAGPCEPRSRDCRASPHAAAPLPTGPASHEPRTTRRLLLKRDMQGMQLRLMHPPSSCAWRVCVGRLCKLPTHPVLVRGPALCARPILAPPCGPQLTGSPGRASRAGRHSSLSEGRGERCPAGEHTRLVPCG